MTILADPVSGEQKLAVESITASVPPPPALPDWLGKRPPVEGDWTKTFDEDFNGNKVDETKWNVYTENFWDKRSHFSKDNVIVADGVAKLHYEKKTGFHKDDPSNFSRSWFAWVNTLFGELIVELEAKGKIDLINNL